MIASSLHLCYRSDLNLFLVRWLTDSTLANLQAEYEFVLSDQRASCTERWLLDLRCRPTPTIEAANWVTYNWLPRAAARLIPARLRLAYLISSARAEALETDPNLQPNVKDAMAPNRHYDLQLFGNEDEAVQWLAT